LTISKLIFSPQRSDRVRRQSIFWAVYCVYYYSQSISPDCIKGLNPDEVLRYAFVSLYCFLPACVFSFYVASAIFLPAFLRNKKYFTLALGFVWLFFACAVIDYFASVAFLKISCHCDTGEIIFMRKFSLGFTNAQNAIMAGGLAIGIKLCRGWYLQKRENLLLTQQKMRNRLRLLKVKIQPSFLFRSLHDITEHIQGGSPGAASMILHLSDLLSYLLYEGEEESVPLTSDLSILEKFIALEMARRGPLLNMRTRVTGNMAEHEIAPMILLPLLQTVFETACPAPAENLSADLHIFTKPAGIFFRFTVHATATLNRPFINHSDAVNNVRNRLNHFYPGNHLLDISEGDGKIEISLDITTNRKGAHAERHLFEHGKKAGYEMA
jgi:hypothetical protein